MAFNDRLKFTETEITLRSHEIRMSMLPASKQHPKSVVIFLKSRSFTSSVAVFLKSRLFTAPDRMRPSAEVQSAALDSEQGLRRFEWCIRSAVATSMRFMTSDFGTTTGSLQPFVKLHSSVNPSREGLTTQGTIESKAVVLVVFKVAADAARTRKCDIQIHEM
jgi:hypothetical protein